MRGQVLQASGARVGPRGSADGLLKVECWCGAAIVRVPAAEVRAGRTGSCGSPWCSEEAS